MLKLRFVISDKGHLEFMPCRIPLHYDNSCLARYHNNEAITMD